MVGVGASDPPSVTGLRSLRLDVVVLEAVPVGEAGDQGESVAVIHLLALAQDSCLSKEPYCTASIISLAISAALTKVMIEPVGLAPGPAGLMGLMIHLGECCSCGGVKGPLLWSSHTACGAAYAREPRFCDLVPGDLSAGALVLCGA